MVGLHEAGVDSPRIKLKVKSPIPLANWITLDGVAIGMPADVFGDPLESLNHIFVGGIDWAYEHKKCSCGLNLIRKIRFDQVKPPQNIVVRIIKFINAGG